MVLKLAEALAVETAAMSVDSLVAMLVVLMVVLKAASRVVRTAGKTAD